MIISDLQHIESATETKVQGGCKWHDRWWGKFSTNHSGLDFKKDSHVGTTHKDGMHHK
jgi:hypothetical protein